MNAALEAIIEGKLWQLDKLFESFGDFAVALPPGGLGVRSLIPAPAAPRAPRCRLFSPVDQNLERTVRPRGRPRKKLASDEDFEPFYTISTAATARDRLLLALKRDHPEHFAAVCALKLSPRAAAVQAGIIAAGLADMEVPAILLRRPPSMSVHGSVTLRSVSGNESQRPMRTDCAGTRATSGVRPRPTLARRAQ